MNYMDSDSRTRLHQIVPHRRWTLLRQMGRLFWAAVYRIIDAALAHKAGLFNVLVYVLGRAPLVQGVYPFGLALFTVVLYRSGPLAGCISLCLACLGMGTRIAGPYTWYWVIAGVVTCCIAATPAGKSLGKRLGYNTLFIMVAGLLTPFLLLVSGWVVPEFILWVPTVLGVWALGNLLVPLTDIVTRHSSRPLQQPQILAAVLTLVGILLGISGLYVRSFALQEIVGIGLLLSAAYIGGMGAAAVGGLLLGLLLTLTGHPWEVVGIYGIFGLLAGLGAEYQKIGITFAFIIANLLLALPMATSTELFQWWSVSALGVVGFTLMPGTFLRRVARIIPRTAEQRHTEKMTNKRLREMVNQRLDDFSRVFEELSTTFAQIPPGQNKRECGYDSFLTCLTQKVCADCAGFRTCWEERFHQTYWDMVDLLAVAEKNPRIEFKDLPESIARYCMQPYQLTTSINYVVEMMRLDSFWQKRLQESQEIVVSQLEGLSHIMRAFASQIELDVEFDEDLELQLQRALQKRRIRLDCLRVARNGKGKAEIRVHMEHCGGVGLCREKIAPIVSQILGQNYSVWTCDCGGGQSCSRCQFVLLPERAYNIEIETVKVTKDGNLISGDTHSQVWLKDGKMAVVLSDGMGHGTRAALESTATISMLKQLMQAGFDRQFAVRTVNSVLLLRSPEETFATVDLAVADLYTGELEFIKIGAPPSFLIRGNEVEVVRSNTLPIGILNNVEMEPELRLLRHGEMLLMVTDGVLDGRFALSEEWVSRVVRRAPSRDPKTIAHRLMDEARTAMGGEARDDMTIVAVRMRRRIGNVDVLETGNNEIPVYDRQPA